jgi:hypothetical protein
VGDVGGGQGLGQDAGALLLWGRGQGEAHADHLGDGEGKGQLRRLRHHRAATRQGAGRPPAERALIQADGPGAGPAFASQNP